MFQSEGPHRLDRHNQIVAGYLALTAGMVNSAGFYFVGSFTSHVTGNVGRFADDLALGHTSAAALAIVSVIAFFVGAFIASMALESSVVRRRPHVYGGLLLLESGLLLTFYGASQWLGSENPRVRDVQALALCAAMGLQNSLVTRLSGAVVRTTHLTGVVTDLGIESARWFRYWRSKVGQATGIRLVAGDEAPVRPSLPKAVLHLTILVAFIVGGACGAILAVYVRRFALAVPCLLTLSASAYAFLTGTRALAGFERR